MIKLLVVPQKAEQFHRALLDLRRQYLNWKHTSETCTLCKVDGFTGCKESCPWPVLTGVTCSSRLVHSLMRQEGFMKQNVKFLRDKAIAKSQPISDRIKELELWIAIYSRYLYYIKVREYSPEMSMKFVNDDLSAGLIL